MEGDVGFETTDAPVERKKRPRDDSDSWTVTWCPDEHRRLVILGKWSEGGQGRRACRACGWCC